MITESNLIFIIGQVFDLKGNEWVTIRNRSPRYAIPRQVLMASLMVYGGYSQNKAGAVCNRCGVDAHHARKTVNFTLLTDKEYGERVRTVFTECRNSKVK